MITLKADNRDLLTNAKYSYLSANYLSGVSSVVSENGLGFATNDYVLFGNFGSEDAEVVKVSGVTTNTLSLATATKFSHSESTKITILPYNQVKFYQTAAATFSATENPLTGYVDIQADDFFTRYFDSTNTTGFGWFIFYNDVTTKATTNSNAMPYAGFANNSAKKILDSFFSQLNNKELKLVTNNDAFGWLDEAYAIAINELNLVNAEFTVSDETDIDVTSGTAEWALETYLPNFGKIVSVWHGTDKTPVLPIDLENVPTWDSESGNTTRYYLRGAYIGFSPQPDASVTYTVRYKQTTSVLTSYYDFIVMPSNNLYCLIDYMMSRAAPKLNRGNGEVEYKRFMTGINRMKLTAHKRDNSTDSWSIDPTANV